MMIKQNTFIGTNEVVVAASDEVPVCSGEPDGRERAVDDVAQIGERYRLMPPIVGSKFKVKKKVHGPKSSNLNYIISLDLNGRFITF